MSDPYREQRPLLCDDYSDEEFHIKNYYQKRNQPSVCIGRARIHAKAAAAVLTRWPDNCSTSVAYWWLGVAMIAVTIFVIYNSVLIFGMMPTSNVKQPKYRTFNNGIKPKVQTLSLPEVYMHLIVNNDTDVQFNQYLPHVGVISKKYPNFNYTFIIIVNDTLKDIHDYNDVERNEIAIKSLWASEINAKKISNKYNISVEYISLTNYLNDSPLKKFWRHLPPHLLPFLIRSISIWEKGGIALNPIILTPEFPNRKYIEKIYTLFNKYINSNGKFVEKKAKTKVYKNNVNKKRPNNIRDIINALNAESNNISEIDLNEAENNKFTVVANTEKKIRSKRNRKHNTNVINNVDLNFKENNITHEGSINSNQSYDSIPNITNDTYSHNIVPLFLKYLFHTKSEKELMTKSELNNVPKTDGVIFDDTINNNQNRSIAVENGSNGSKQRDGYNDTENISKFLNKPIPDGVILSKSNKYNSIPELTIDIMGNIIASKTPCHAFLGTMFSNVIHHTGEESITDFILSELSLFCNGLLNSCAGIDVVLV